MREKDEPFVDSAFLAAFITFLENTCYTHDKVRAPPLWLNEPGSSGNGPQAPDPDGGRRSGRFSEGAQGDGWTCGCTQRPAKSVIFILEIV